MTDKVVSNCLSKMVHKRCTSILRIPECPIVTKNHIIVHFINIKKIQNSCQCFMCVMYCYLPVPSCLFCPLSWPSNLFLHLLTPSAIFLAFHCLPLTSTYLLTLPTSSINFCLLLLWASEQWPQISMVCFGPKSMHSCFIMLWHIVLVYPCIVPFVLLVLSLSYCSSLSLFVLYYI